MESFVISVSLGTGCHRHIQISANATLYKLTSSLPVSAEEYCDRIQRVIVIDAPLREVLNLMKRDGVPAHKNWDLEEFAALCQNLNNHTHKHANRGNTPDELSQPGGYSFGSG